jgi:hypothetical protein
MGAKVFKHLPTEIKSMPNDLKNFKLHLATFLMQNSVYTNDFIFYDISLTCTCIMYCIALGFALYIFYVK